MAMAVDAWALGLGGTGGCRSAGGRGASRALRVADGGGAGVVVAVVAVAVAVGCRCGFCGAQHRFHAPENGFSLSDIVFVVVEDQEVTHNACQAGGGEVESIVTDTHGDVAKETQPAAQNLQPPALRTKNHARSCLHSSLCMVKVPPTRPAMEQDVPPGHHLNSIDGFSLLLNRRTGCSTTNKRRRNTQREPARKVPKWDRGSTYLRQADLFQPGGPPHRRCRNVDGGILQADLGFHAVQAHVVRRGVRTVTRCRVRKQRVPLHGDVAYLSFKNPNATRVNLSFAGSSPPCRFRASRACQTTPPSSFTMTLAIRCALGTSRSKLRRWRRHLSAVTIFSVVVNRSCAREGMRQVVGRKGGGTKCGARQKPCGAVGKARTSSVTGCRSYRSCFLKYLSTNTRNRLGAYSTFAANMTLAAATIWSSQHSSGTTCSVHVLQRQEEFWPHRRHLTHMTVPVREAHTSVEPLEKHNSSPTAMGHQQWLLGTPFCSKNCRARPTESTNGEAGRGHTDRHTNAYAYTHDTLLKHGRHQSLDEHTPTLPEQLLRLWPQRLAKRRRELQSGGAENPRLTWIAGHAHVAYTPLRACACGRRITTAPTTGLCACRGHSMCGWSRRSASSVAGGRGRRTVHRTAVRQRNRTMRCRRANAGNKIRHVVTRASSLRLVHAVLPLHTKCADQLGPTKRIHQHVG